MTTVKGYSEADIIRHAEQLAGSADALAHRIRELEPGPANETLGQQISRTFEANALRHRLAAEFGLAHSWYLSKTRFSIRCLARRGHHDGSDNDPSFFFDDGDMFDHSYHYRTPNRRAAAIATHFYNSSGDARRSEITSWAAAHDLAATFPEFPSWWFPGWTTLVRYQPAR